MNLTENQTAIISSLSSEFIKLNEQFKPVQETTDLTALIDNAVNEKQKLRDEVLITNSTYNKANIAQIEAIIDTMNGLLNKYGYKCKLEIASIGNHKGYTEYFSIKIDWVGHKTKGYEHCSDESTSIYFHPRANSMEGITYLTGGSVRMYKKYFQSDEIYSLEELMKYVAELIIEKKKSLIKI